jgi:hypothetical protein
MSWKYADSQETQDNDKGYELDQMDYDDDEDGYL